jgi:Na+-driven multidrug efflux pump
MAIESPISVGVISRLPEATGMTAAFTVMMGLAMWIESPVIDLLSTSTTLVTDQQSYLRVRSFSLWAMGLVTAAHLGFTVSPLYDWVTLRVMSLPPEVAQAARTGMLLVTPWSACIGWRRFLQGILIRQGRTKAIGLGTVVRVLTMAGVAIGLYLLRWHSGIVIVAVALVASVLAEALFIHYVARPVVRALPQGDSHLDLRKLGRFHFPLTATTVVLMLGGPMVTAALARIPDSVQLIAAFQVANSIVWLCRTITFALPEVVITLANGAEARAVLLRFCAGVGLVCSISMLVLYAVGLDLWLFRSVLRAPPETAELAHAIFLTYLLVPVLNALQSYVRGVLTAAHQTSARLWSMWAGMVAMFLSLGFALWVQMPGILVGAFGLTFALAVELACLAWFWSRHAATAAALAR